MEIILPNELQYHFLSFITDTETYLNCRLVCKNWYNEFKQIKNFENNKLIEITKINKNLICTFNIHGNLLRQIKFENYGYYSFQTFFDRKLVNSIRNKPPFKIEEYKYYNSILSNKKTINLKENEIKNETFPIMNCLIS